MTSNLGIVFLALASFGQLVLPRRWAVLPLLMTFAWIPRGQFIMIDSTALTFLRLIIAIGFLRCMLRREGLSSGWNAMDSIWTAWGVWMVASWAFHDSNDLAFRCGLVWDYLGSYFLLRVLVRDMADIRRVIALSGFVLVPIGVLMLVEHSSGQNPFEAMGGLTTQSRGGVFRAAGPFAHPILAGTVGATCIALSLSQWHRHTLTSLVGFAAGAAIVFSAASSGPVLMVCFALLAMVMWRVRSVIGLVLGAAIAGIAVLQLVMNDPFYYLMARVDIFGGSTGWHRARLIHSALDHLPEWWLVGTDMTRHWMPTGIQANTQHTDLTNHYLVMGVMGGLPLMLAFVASITLGFRWIGNAALRSNLPDDDKFQMWAVGAVLFGHVMNFFSANLFDQSIVSFMMLLAISATLNEARSARAGGRVSPQGRPIGDYSRLAGESLDKGVPYRRAVPGERRAPPWARQAPDRMGPR